MVNKIYKTIINIGKATRGLLAGFNVVILCFGLLGCTASKIYNIDDFGAVNDGVSLNTKAIQSAINTCSLEGGGQVLVEKGIYITGTIILKDNVTLKINEGAQLVSSINPNDFISIDPFIDATGQYRGQCLIGAIDAKNVAIIGKGTIDGRGEMFAMNQIKKTMDSLGEILKEPVMPKVDTTTQNYVNKQIRPSYRPFLIRLVRTDSIAIVGVKLRQPAAWTLHFYQCKNFGVDGISIYSHANRNNDGIDIDSSSDGYVVNSIVNSGDDAVCFKTTSPIPTKNIKVNQCTLTSDWGAIKFGTESMGNFENIEVTNCKVQDTKGGGIKILSVDGAKIKNIRIDSIDMKNVDMPIFIRLGERRLVYRDAPKQPVGTINNVSISNITATTRVIEESRLKFPTGIFITGTLDHHINEVLLNNIHITLPGGAQDDYSNVEIPENPKKYPEYIFFTEVLPAYGLFARNIDGLKTNNVEFKLTASDSRKEIIRYE